MDKPLVQQYFIYLSKLAHGDLGPSFKNKDFTVAQLIGTGLPVSARLGLPTSELAVIGDDNNDFVYVGASREFTATRDGALFLGINEGYLDDNTGAYKVKIEIIPDDGK